jgi:hypothetical protein
MCVVWFLERFHRMRQNLNPRLNLNSRLNSKIGQAFSNMETARLDRRTATQQQQDWTGVQRHSNSKTGQANSNTATARLDRRTSIEQANTGIMTSENSTFSLSVKSACR